MQTFLPYESFLSSAKVLDYKRLGKQRVEARQIIYFLVPIYGGKWINHPAVRMWKGYEDALKYYYNTMVNEWVNRGYENNMKLERFNYPPKFPSWLGDYRLHSSHRSNLLRKEPEFYSKYGWTDDPSAPYWWPVELKNKELNERMDKFWDKVLKL